MSNHNNNSNNDRKLGISAINRVETYDIIGQYIAEIYDRVETQRDDVALIKLLIGDRPAKILEPFCGHGRILIPLAETGYEVTGLDLSEQLLRSLDDCIRQLSNEIQARVSFHKSDVIADEWPTGFDIVVLGANCFYELATPEEQEHCIKAAARALVPGGYLYLDNAHMEGKLAREWCNDLDVLYENQFPTGICADGTQVKGTMKTVWCDVDKRLVRIRRTVEITTPDGKNDKREWMQQKHPPSTVEMRSWLQKHGLVIENLWGDREQSPYTDESGRAIFWAKLDKK